jgi:phage baseplate assembly protein W
MKTSTSTGWLFRGAGLAGAMSELAAPEGLGLTPGGRVAMVSGDEAIRQSIILLLTTIPGERVMRPDFGCPLHRLMFAPNDATTAGLAIHYVRQALIRFEPRVDIVSLDADAAGAVVRDSGQAPAGDNEPEDERGRGLEDGSKLVVSLVYRAKATNHLESLELEVGLDGEGLR